VYFLNIKNETIKKLLDELVQFLDRKKVHNRVTPKVLDVIKRNTARDLHLPNVPRNSDILRYIKNIGQSKYGPLAKYFVKKPMRTGSGVVPLAVMVKPEGSCKHNCIYCSYTGKAAKSYTGEEPAALRARGANFDPYLQVKTRLRQYEETGHDTTKIELIVMGGTFLEMDDEYKNYFIKSLYDSLNNSVSGTLKKAIEKNENARHRTIGLTIETRPDACDKKLINKLLEWGCTRVELGVQHPDNKIYEKIKRGHKVKDVVDATQNLRDAGIKVLYHLMPGLPGSNPKKDIEMIERIFEDHKFKPDMIKIYPTLLMPNTELYKWYTKGEYTPYNSELAAGIIAEAYRYIPKYVRVMRIQRDIPANLIEDGVKKSNLRQLVEKELKEKHIKSVGIRDREIGKVDAKIKNQMESLSVKVLEYETAGGKEFFISYENKDVIAGFTRLRIPKNSWKCNGMQIRDCAFLRELHVYGEEAPLGEKGEAQHRGIGSKLLNKAEEIAKEHNMKNLLIQSGIGVREYYRKRGYILKETYMCKKL